MPDAAAELPAAEAGMAFESKLRVLLRELAAMRARDPTAKALVFTQFTQVRQPAARKREGERVHTHLRALLLCTLRRMASSSPWLILVKARSSPGCMPMQTLEWLKARLTLEGFGYRTITGEQRDGTGWDTLRQGVHSCAHDGFNPS